MTGRMWVESFSAHAYSTILRCIPFPRMHHSLRDFISLRIVIFLYNSPNWQEATRLLTRVTIDHTLQQCSKQPCCFSWSWQCIQPQPLQHLVSFIIDICRVYSSHNTLNLQLCYNQRIFPTTIGVLKVRVRLSSIVKHLVWMSLREYVVSLDQSAFTLFLQRLRPTCFHHSAPILSFVIGAT